MKFLTITFELEDSATVTLPAKPNKPVIAAKRSNGGTKSQTAEQVCQTKSAKLVMGYFQKLKPGRRVPRGRVGALLRKKGYNSSTAMPAMSALYRAGYISRLGRGVYAAK